MKKSFILSLSLALIVFTALTLISTQSSTHPNAPDWGYTAAPTESTCGKSTCHNNTPNSGSGSVTITFDSQFYIPGNTYVVTVATDETGMSRFGFETCCLDASNIKAGSQSLINTNNTSANTVVNNRWYVGHKSAGAAEP